MSADLDCSADIFKDPQLDGEDPDLQTDPNPKHGPAPAQLRSVCPDPQDPRAHYVGDSQNNPEICRVIKFFCEPHQKLFSSQECGCGCFDISEAPQPCGPDLPPCSTGHFCKLPLDAQCDSAAGPGTCTKIPAACITLIDPVCGCDGQTYSNECFASIAGVSVNSETACTGTGAACRNGGFETGDFTDWDGATGINDAGQVSDLVAGLVEPTRHSIMQGAGNDPLVAALPVVPPGGGGFSVRLGNSDDGKELEQLTQTFTVTSATRELFFRYALVLEDPDEHTASEKPFFMIRVLDQNNQQVFREKRVADQNDPFFDTVGNDVVFRRWSCGRIDLTPYLGQDVTIEFTVADCALGGHFGYAYIDEVCSAEPDFVSLQTESQYCSDSIRADGTGSTDEINHFWSIQESDQNWNRIGPEIMQWFSGQAGEIDLRDFAESRGLKLKCDTYYRVKLAVQTECLPWQETSDLIYIKPCPTADAGGDQQICLSAPVPVQIGSLGQAGNTYSWTSVPAGFVSTDPNPVVSPATTTEYTLTVTNPEGCTASDSVTVTGVNPGVSISVTGQDCCSESRTLSADIEEALGYSWTTYPQGKPGDGDQSQSLTVSPDERTWYTVTATNFCGTFFDQVSVVPATPPKGPLPQIIAPNAFTPGGKNPLFIVYELGVDPDQPAYNACEWRFIVWDRWGDEQAHLEGQATYANNFGTPTLINGELPKWDGTNDQGTLLPEGVYVWRLLLKNCTGGWKIARTATVHLIF